jgi:hypothetical protein
MEPFDPLIHAGRKPNAPSEVSPAERGVYFDLVRSQNLAHLLPFLIEGCYGRLFSEPAFSNPPVKRRKGLHGVSSEVYRVFVKTRRIEPCLEETGQDLGVWGP